MFTLTSTAHVTALKFATEAEVDAFIRSRRFSEETLCLVDAADNLIWIKRFD